jgi:hypothetical protein
VRDMRERDSEGVTYEVWFGGVQVAPGGGVHRAVLGWVLVGDSGI